MVIVFGGGRIRGDVDAAVQELRQPAVQVFLEIGEERYACVEETQGRIRLVVA